MPLIGRDSAFLGVRNVSPQDRRLPVYLLLDCSESMAGSAIEDLSQGVAAMVASLQHDPSAVESAWLSVITFSREAKQVVPLAPLMTFQCPKLSVRTGTALGAALRLLVTCIEREVVRTTSETKGDWRPLVFLFTDGQPTDAWEEAAEQVRATVHPRIANIYAIGCGPDVDVDILREITDVVFLMPENLSGETWRKVFVWMSASVQTTSQAVESRQDSDRYPLPELPQGALTAAPASSGPRDPNPRQVFLHAICSKTGKPYLMRFARRPYDEKYEAIASHPLEVIEEDAGEALPPVNTALLAGCPSCPHCGNSAAALCECDTLMCCSGSAGDQLSCPRCHRTGGVFPGEGPGFDVCRAEG